MHKIMAALWISVLLAPTAAFAQTQLTNDRVGTIRIPGILGPTRIMDNAVNRESVEFAALPPLRQQPSQQRSWRVRHPVLFGTLIGLGIGLVVEAAVIPGESGGEPHSVYVPMFAGAGAGIGSLVGLIVSASRQP